MGEPDYEVITTAAGLRKVAQAIAHGTFQFSVFIVGRGGTGKSSLIREALPPIDPDDPPHDVSEGAHWIRGMVGAPALYIELWRHRDRTIVADDCHNLYADPHFRPLLKQINETERSKVVAWNKMNQDMRDMGVPPSFTTASRFILIGNDWRTLDRDLAAVEDRVHLFRYEPTDEELIRYAEPWFPDKDVLRYAENAVSAGRVQHLSLRVLIKAIEIKATGLVPWESYLDRRFQGGEGQGFSDDMRAILGWAERNGKATFTVGEVGRSLSRFKGDRDRRDAALAWLLDRQLIHELPRPGSGRQGGRPVEALYGIGATPAA